MSKSGGVFAFKHSNSKSNGLEKPIEAGVTGDFMLPRKVSLPGDTPLQRRRLSVVEMNGMGVVDENADRYVFVCDCV